MLKEGKEIYVFGIPKDVAEKLKSFINIFHKGEQRKNMDVPFV